MNREKSELVPEQLFNFVGYQFDLKEGRVRPTPDRWQVLTTKIQAILAGLVCPVRQFMSLIGLSTHSNRKASPPRSAPYEAHTVALDEQLEDSRVTGKGDISSLVAPSSLKMVAGGKQCASRSTITPTRRVKGGAIT